MKIELDDYCPCCDYNTFARQDRLNYAICPICFWEDDPLQFDNPSYAGGANAVSLSEARKNFSVFGACEKGLVKHCRKPNKKDRKKSLGNK